MQKRALGKGLAALISENSAALEDNAHVQEVPLSSIAANPMQPRTLFDPIKLEELCASIKEHGVLQPILLRRIGHERYQLLAGERRFRAATGAGLTSIPALVKECTELQQLEIALVENVQREDIGALEAARAYRQMSDQFGMTQEAIAARVGKSRAAVANTMGLLDLPDAVQESLEVGQITEGHARALKSLKDASAILTAWEAVLKRGLSVRETERLARETRTAPPPGAIITSGAPDRRRTDPNVASLVTRLQERLQTRVTLRHTGGTAGKLEIDFYTDDDLTRVFDLLLGA